MLVKLWNDWNFSSVAGGTQRGTATVEDGLRVLPEVSTHRRWEAGTPLRCSSGTKGNGSTCTQRSWRGGPYSSFIFNRWKLDTIPRPITWGTEKQNATQSGDGVLLSNGEEGTTDTGHLTGDSRWHDADQASEAGTRRRCAVCNTLLEVSRVTARSVVHGRWFDRKILWSDRNVPSLYCGGCYRAIYICENSSVCALKVGGFYCTHAVPP